MSRYLIRRVLLFIPTLWVAISLVFILFRLVPGDPARLIAGEMAPESVVESIRAQMGLDQPLPRQYVQYMGQLLTGDLGYSKVFQQNATDQILERLPATLLLALAAMFLAVIIGVPAGVLSAIRPYSWLDYATMALAVGGVSLPGFWLGLMLIIGFSVYLGLFPVAGFNGPAAIVLPAVTLSAHQMAIIARMTRSTMLGVLGEDYVRTARAKGLREQAITIGHALRNALIPTTTVAGLQLGYLLGGSVVIETVFAWPGIGRLLISSIEMRDYPMVQAIAVVYGILMLAVNLLVDILYAALDPRVHYD